MKKSILKKVMALSMAATMLCLTACGNTGAQSEAPVLNLLRKQVTPLQ